MRTLNREAEGLSAVEGFESDNLEGRCLRAMRVRRDFFRSFDAMLLQYRTGTRTLGFSPPFTCGIYRGWKEMCIASRYPSILS